MKLRKYINRYFVAIKENNLLNAIIMTMVAFIICILVSKGTIRTSSDDMLISINVYNGHYDTIFISWFFSAFLIQLQNLFRGINVFVCSQLIMNAISITAIIFVILDNKKTNISFRLLISCLVLLLFSPFCFVKLQWTISASIICTSGFLLFFAKTRLLITKIIKSVTSFVLILYGSFLRIESFYAVSAIIFIIIFFTVVLYVLKLIKRKKSIKKFVIIRLKPLLLLIILILIPFITNFASEEIKTSTISGYSNYKQYSFARHFVIDYGVLPYKDNIKYYNSIGISSQNDLDVYQTWIYDSDYYSTDKLHAIADLAKNNYSTGYHFSLKLIINFLQKKIAEYTNINPIFVMIILAVLFTIAMAFLFVLRNRIKILFPIILSFVWVLYFYVFRISEANILMVVIAALAIFIAFFYNRYYFVFTSVLSFLSIGLVSYLNFERLIFRSAFVFEFPTIIIFFLMLTNKKSIRKRVKNNIGYKITYNATISLIAVITVIFCVLLSPLGVELKDNTKVYNYVKTNASKNVFVSNTTYFSNQYKNPLRYEDFSNIIPCGWLDGSEYSISLQEKFNIISVYKGLYDKDNMCIICDESSKELIEKFYKEHYSASIVLSTIKQFDECTVYSVTDENDCN